MSITPELIKSKLSSLDQSTDTIISVSSWLLFHRRSASLIVDTWLQAVRDGSSNRKLSLIYLANEVSQQSRAKKRPEYPAEFGRVSVSVMPEAIENVFRHATVDVQGKITRVVDVWKQRSVYAEPVLAEINSRINGKERPVATASAARPSAGIPNELTTVADVYTKLFGATSSASMALGTSSNLYSNLFEDEAGQAPSELYAAKLRQLDAALVVSQKTVEASLRMRQELANQLQELVDRNQAAMKKDGETLIDLAEKQVVAKQAAETNTEKLVDRAAHSERSTTPDMAPPTPEALTPPAADFDMTNEPATTMQQEHDAAQNGQHDESDPVARLQLELDPSITALLARQSNSSNIDAPNGDEDPYIP